MKKIAAFIPAVLWLILSICYFVEGNIKKGIVFMVCAACWAVVELVYMKWQNKGK